MRKSIISGAVHGFLAVALGAFGAHALEDILDDYSTGIWDTAVQYQMFHARFCGNQSVAQISFLLF